MTQMSQQVRQALQRPRIRRFFEPFQHTYSPRFMPIVAPAWECFSIDGSFGYGETPAAAYANWIAQRKAW